MIKFFSSQVQGNSAMTPINILHEYLKNLKFYIPSIATWFNWLPMWGSSSSITPLHYFCCPPYFVYNKSCVADAHRNSGRRRQLCEMTFCYVHFSPCLLYPKCSGCRGEKGVVQSWEFACTEEIFTCVKAARGLGIKRLWSWGRGALKK